MSTFDPVAPPVAGRRRTRGFWRTAHRLLGLGLSGVLALLGLSGSLLVFYTDIDAWLDTPVRRAPAGEAIVAYEPVWRALQAAHPDRPGSWRIELPSGDTGLVTARYLKPAETAGVFFAPLLVTVRPATGEVLASRFWGDTPMTWLYDLHYTLLAGEAGRIVVGAAGVGMLVMLATGVWLWWPSPRRWRAALSLKRGASPARRHFDLHQLAGIYGLVLSGVLAFTGVVLAWPQWIDPLVQRLSPVKPLPVVENRARAAPMITLDAALQSARAHFPLGVPRWVDTPGVGQGVFRVRLAQPGEPSARFPRSFVWVDAYDGSVRAAADGRDSTPGSTFMAWIHPLHNGEAFGLIGRCLAVLGGGLPLMLMITGILRWRDRRRARAAALRRQCVRSAIE